MLGFSTPQSIKRRCWVILGFCFVDLRRGVLLAIPLAFATQGSAEVNNSWGFISRGEGRNPTVED